MVAFDLDACPRCGAGFLSGSPRTAVGGRRGLAASVSNLPRPARLGLSVLVAFVLAILLPALLALF